MNIFNNYFQITNAIYWLTWRQWCRDVPGKVNLSTWLVHYVTVIYWLVQWMISSRGSRQLSSLPTDTTLWSTSCHRFTQWRWPILSRSPGQVRLTFLSIRVAISVRTYWWLTLRTTNVIGNWDSWQRSSDTVFWYTAWCRRNWQRRWPISRSRLMCWVSSFYWSFYWHRFLIRSHLINCSRYFANWSLRWTGAAP